MSPGIRAFVAINLPDPLKADVGRRQRKLTQAPGGQAVRWIAGPQVHLTLRFLGDVPGDSVLDIHVALQRAVAGFDSFELRLAEWGCFPGARQPRIFWIGLACADDVLSRLQGAIVRETQVWGKVEARSFQPHLTVGRVRPEHARTASRLVESFPPDARLPSARWRVRGVDLMQSTLWPSGAEYSVLASVPLLGDDLRPV